VADSQHELNMILLNRYFVFFTFLMLAINLIVAAQTVRIIATRNAKIDGWYYVASLYSNNSIALKRQGDGKKLVWNEKQLQLGYAPFSSFQFVDFNNDGYKDLLIDYLTNVPDVHDLLLYDKISKSFIKVNQFEKYPAAIHIPQTDLYYSYHRSGCADMTWNSDLFIIKNFKAIAIGDINGIDCNGDDVKDGIYISKINRDKSKPYRKLSISTLNRSKVNKWDFIEEYWKRHYHEFLNSN
jgi:hypothetical protein